MTIFSFILIISAIVFIKLLGGLFTLKFKDKLHLVLGFSAGALMAVALFDLLPESLELTSGTYDMNTSLLLLMVGFSIYLLIDRLFSLHNHDNCDKASHNSTFSLVAIILHSFLDGFSIGIAFQVSDIVGISVALAVLAHSFSDGINAASLVMKSKKQSNKWLIINSIIPVAGLFLSYLIKISEASLGLILAVFAGLFLYISTNDLMPESHHKHSSLWTSLATVLGVVFIVLVVILFE